jgi:hypothetical protein
MAGDLLCLLPCSASLAFVRAEHRKHGKDLKSGSTLVRTDPSLTVFDEDETSPRKGPSPPISVEFAEFFLGKKETIISAV